MANPLDTSEDVVHRSPPLGALAVVFVVLFVASVAANFLMTDFAPYPVPYNPIAQLQDDYTRFPDAVRAVSFLQMSASIPLGLFSAVIVSRLLFLGLMSPVCTSHSSGVSRRRSFWACLH
jgi:hypothetical protein